MPEVRISGDDRSVHNLHTGLRHCWHPVARTSQLGNSPVAVELLGTYYAIARLGSVIRAFCDDCPHRGAPLSAGTVVGSELQCPYHGYRFDASGRCVAIPAIDASVPIPAKARLQQPWGLTERYGLIWLAPEEPLADLPEVAEWEDPALSRVDLEPLRWRTSAAQATDNFLDVAHFPFVHAGTFGDTADVVIPDIHIERRHLAFDYRYSHLASNPEDVKRMHGLEDDFQVRVMSFRYTAPFSLVARVDYEATGVQNVVFITSQPENESTTTIYTSLLGDDFADDPESARKYEERILVEDQWMLERYRTYRLPLDLSAQLHTKADRMTVEFRRVLTELFTYAKELETRTH